jgi:acyl-coenzyme A synthetase/AMP-(fatty) acid ligase
VSDDFPLWASAEPGRPIAFRHGRRITLARFAQHVGALRGQLPAGGAMINLCEDRYHFLVAYAAALSAGHTALLPPAGAEQLIDEIQRAHPGSYRCADVQVAATLDAPSVVVQARIAADQVALVGVTSASTGQPKSYPKTWRTLNGSSARAQAAIRASLAEILPANYETSPSILATVPAQHTYGMEFSVLLPLLGGMAIHAGRPLFPADIANALSELPEPRILVSTPLHLRAMVESQQPFPPVTLVVSATAPLDRELAIAVERRFGGHLLEIFGSTETGAFASRRTAIDATWKLFDGVRLQPGSDDTLVDASWFAAPVRLQDIVELQGEGTFVVRGRSSDMIEVAGKRASLADLTRRILAIDGVRDAVVFQPDPEAVAKIRRVAALVVAPGLDARAIRERLARSVDPAFLPRPLVLVDALPRNDVGKLPLARLLELLPPRG